MAEHELWNHAKIQKTSGRKPPSCDEMQRAAEAADPNARVWRGSEVPTTEQGIKILGCPLGHEDFVSAQLEATTRKHQVLLQAIPTVPDVQSAWSLLLHCAVARANYQLRVLRPDVVSFFARAHDAGVWQCPCAVPRIPDTSCEEVASSGPGWVGFEERCSHQCRRSLGKLAVVATRTVHVLAQEVDSPVLGAVRRAVQELEGVSGFVVPSLPALTTGLRFFLQESPSSTSQGAQGRRGSSEECRFCHMLRSQSGPAAGVAFSALPSSPLTRFQPVLFPVLLQRRLALP